jgi:tripartite-type tricarboxylate transporter receptor subunit TctC
MVPYLQEELGVSVVVTNKAGGGGQVGSQLLLSKEADGYNLLMASFPATITGILLTNAPYTIDDFDYICGQQEDPRMLVTGSNAPFKTLEEFIGYAKENPGLITVSNAGTGSSSWFSALALEIMADIEIVKVPFGGSAKALAALLGGHVMAQAPTLSYIYGPRKEGKVVGLAIMSEERHPDFPEVPTFKEKGFNLFVASVRGILAPKGLPEDVLTKLRDAFTAVMNNPDFLEQAKKADLLIYHRDGERFEKYAEEQFEIFTQLVKEMEQ